MTSRVNHFLLGNETLRSDVRNTQSRLEDTQKTSIIAKSNDRALNMLFEILSSLTESSDGLNAEDCNHFFARPNPSSTPANNSPTVPTTSTIDKPWPASRMPIRGTNAFNNPL